MSIDTRALRSQITSAVSATGLFDGTYEHEPKAAPGKTGVSAAVVWGGMRSVQSSGLAALSMRLVFTVRVYTSMLQEPQDGIDPQVMDAADALFGVLAGGFELDGEAREVDFFGAHGEPMNAEPGYLTQDSTVFRTVDITVPVIINDAYPLSE